MNVVHQDDTTVGGSLAYIRNQASSISIFPVQGIYRPENMGSSGCVQDALVEISVRGPADRGLSACVLSDFPVSSGKLPSGSGGAKL